MFGVFRFTVCVIALTICVLRPATETLHAYFRAMLVATFAELLAVLVLPETSRLYILIYCAFALWIFACMYFLTWEALRYHPARWMAWILGFLCASACAFGAAAYQHLGFYNWLSIIEGSLTVLVAVPMGWAAAYLHPHERKLALVLMGMWLAQAVFGYGMTLHLWNENWMRANEWVPTTTVIVGCLWASRTSGRTAHEMANRCG